jgi:hypothetical protein
MQRYIPEGAESSATPLKDIKTAQFQLLDILTICFPNIHLHVALSMSFAVFTVAVFRLISLQKFCMHFLSPYI